MKFFSALALSFFLMYSSWATAQKDTQLISDYIYYTRLVFNYLKRDPSLVPDVSRDEMEKMVKTFEADPKRVIPVDQRPLDNRGLEKAAVFNRYTNQVQVHRSTWKSSGINERAMITAMELLGISGMDRDRYEVVVFNIFPLEEDVKKLEKIQERLCDASAKLTLSLSAGYTVALRECWNEWKGTQTAPQMEARLKKAIARCKLECTTGNNELKTQGGWCDEAFMIDQIKAESKQLNGNKCI